MDVVALTRPVSDLLRDTAEAVVRPRFRHLTSGEVSEKSPGEVVTVADGEAEELIRAGLRRLTPGFRVVGEEAAAADPALIAEVRTAARCWLVDPIDGTGNFVDGSPDYAVMATLLEAGRPIGAWIWQPEHDQMWTAVRGNGTRRNGVLVRPPPRRALSSMRVGVLSRFLDEPTRASVHEHRLRFATVQEGPRCAGVTYPQLIEGRYDAVLFWRTLPWDHAPGALMLEEAGGSALRLDGSAYMPGDEQAGLLAVGAAAAWQEVRESLLDSGPTADGP